LQALFTGNIHLTGTVHTQKSAEVAVRSLAATVDADLSPNAAGHRLLSEMFEDSKRTFETSGIIEANDASEGEIATREVPFESSRANGAALTVMEDFVPPAK
jgi:hypothetical protein